MEKTQIHRNGNVSNHYHASVPAYYAPTITGTKVVGGESFYMDSEGKLHRQSLYDKNFKVTKGKVYSRSFKGLSPAYKNR